MRKQLKNKRRSCALCKPHKRAWENRWTPRERSLQKQARLEIARASIAEMSPSS